MKERNRTSSVLHGLLHLAHHEGPATSEWLAQCLNTNPVVVRRLMAGLRKKKIVSSEKGHGGGWSLSRDLNKITVLEVLEAIDDERVRISPQNSHQPKCLLERIVHQSLKEAQESASQVLRKQLSSLTLAELKNEFERNRGSSHV